MFPGAMVLTAIAGVLLVSTDAGGAAYALAMVSILGVLGLFNFFAVRRYGSTGRRRQH